MLSEKYNGRIRFLKDTPTLNAALVSSGVKGTILTASAMWFRTDKPTTCEAEFLVCDGDANPWQISSNFDGKKWTSKKIDVSKELGQMTDEVAFAKKQKFLSEAEILDILKGQNPVKKAMRRAPHMLVISSAFTIFDEEFNVPTWRFTLKNWPLINYLKVEGEESRTVDATIDAIKGRILSCKEYQ